MEPRYNRHMLLKLLWICAVLVLPLSAQKRDAHLQSAVEQAMAGRRGTAVVLDVASNRVLAAYHLQVAARQIARPGSSIKPFTLLALLERKKIDSRTPLMCKRTLTIAGRRLDCTHPDVAEPLTPVTALAYSCNFYFASMAQRLTPEQLHARLASAGFGSVTGLAVNEAAGSVALAASPEQLQLQAIGEWGVRITPLELLRGYRDLALLSHSGADEQLAPLISDGLQGSVRYGMARAAKPASEMNVAGKTGTAAADKGPWTHGWFAGYAPANDPQIAVVVFLEKGHGSDAAALAGEIFEAFAATSNRATAAAHAGSPTP